MHQILASKNGHLAMFGARLIEDEIVMEHVTFWFFQSHVCF
jgi:hypothetical protein